MDVLTPRTLDEALRRGLIDRIGDFGEWTRRLFVRRAAA
mgnify:CR=1 FL=1